MHTVSPTPTSRAPRAFRLLARLAGSGRRHRDRIRLAALSDHMLADIGLTRDSVRWMR